MEEFLETTRERVRRELVIHMTRARLTPWQVAAGVAEVARDAPSDRHNMPDPTHRTIEGLLAGRGSNANTVRLVRNYLIAKVKLDPVAIDVDPHVVRAARAGMIALSDRTVSPAALARYCGVYTVGNPEGSQYAFGLIVDLESTSKTLLVRAIVRGGLHHDATMLQGYAIPSQHQLTISLTATAATGRYSIVISHESESFPSEFDVNIPVRPALVLPAEVAVPRFENGGYVSDSAYVPVTWGGRSEVQYKLMKMGSQHEPMADVFNDGRYANALHLRMYGYVPNPRGTHPGGPGWLDD